MVDIRTVSYSKKVSKIDAKHLTQILINDDRKALLLFGSLLLPH